MYFAALPEEREKRLETYLGAIIARALGIAPAQINVFTSLVSFGFDSLMAMTLRSQVEAELGITVPIASLLHDTSLKTLSTTIQQALTATRAPSTIKMTAMTLDGPSNFENPSTRVPVNQPPTSTTEDLLDKVDQLSDEQVKALLEQMINSGGSSHGQ